MCSLSPAEGKRQGHLRKGGTCDSPKVYTSPYGRFPSSQAYLGGGGDQPTDLEAFTDSEAAGNFINEALVTHLGLPVDPLPYPIPVLALDG